MSNTTHPDWRGIIVNTLVMRDGDDCQFCQKPIMLGDRFNFDHIRPLSANGLSVIENMQLVHGHCNQAKAVEFDQKMRNKYRNENREQWEKTTKENVIRADKLTSEQYQKFDKPTIEPMINRPPHSPRPSILTPEETLRADLGDHFTVAQFVDVWDFCFPKNKISETTPKTRRKHAEEFASKHGFVKDPFVPGSASVWRIK